MGSRVMRQPVDVEELPDTTLEEYFPHHQSTYLFDPLGGMNYNEHLEILCSWMYDTRRRYGCEVRASDFDVSFQVERELDDEGCAERRNINRVIEPWITSSFTTTTGMGDEPIS